MEYYEDEPLNEAVGGVGMTYARTWAPQAVGRVTQKVAPEVAKKVPAASWIGNIYRNIQAGAYNHMRQNHNTISHRVGSGLAAAPGATARFAGNAATGTASAAARHPGITIPGAVGGGMLYVNTANQLRDEQEAAEHARAESENEEFDPDNINDPGVGQTLTRSAQRIWNLGRGGRDNANRLIDSAERVSTGGIPVRFQLGGGGTDNSDSDSSGVQGPSRLEEIEKEIRKKWSNFKQGAKTAAKYGAAGATVAAGVGGIAMHRRIKHTRWLSTRCAMAKTPSERSACEKYVYQHEMKELRDEQRRCVHANDPVNCEERINKQMEELKNEFETI